MIQYKLINEYPGSPELGTIHWFQTDELGPSSNSVWKGTKFYNSHPQFWEKVEELDYEILSFVSTSRLSNNKPSKLLSNGNHTWLSDTYPNELNEEELLNGEYAIHSVKRLSDGEVFTIGDKVDVFKAISNATIKKFELSEGESCWIEGIWAFYDNGSCAINNLTKSKKTPLFTTEDGVGIFDGDCFYWFHTNTDGWGIRKSQIGVIIDLYQTTPNVKTFSSKEKAEEYVLMNKPCLCINDLIYYKKSPKGYATNSIVESFKELVKSKL